MHIRIVSLSLVAVASLAAGCSSDAGPVAEPAPATEAQPATDAPPTDNSAAASIAIEGFAFSSLDPVAPGTEIDVSNLDGALHTLTADDGSFNTGGLDGGASGTIFAPATPGVYTFICNIHPSMTGALTVEG